MQIPAFYFAPVPASVAHDPSAFAWSIFGLLGTNLLALEYARQMVFRFLHDPRPIRHPLTIQRSAWFCMMVGIILRSGPDVLQITLWPDVSPAYRFGLAHWNRLLDGASFIPMAAGFYLISYGRKLIESQLAREPIPIDLWPRPDEKLRAGFAFVLLVTISVVIAFR